MSIFDNNTSQENSEELLYQAIKEELKPVLEKWDDRCGMQDPSHDSYQAIWRDPDRTKLIKETSKIVLQFVWRKLGLKLPDYTRQVLDSDYNLLEFKQDK